MADLALAMLDTTFDGFMKHDLDILSGVLKEEQRLNEMESTIVRSLVGVSKSEISRSDKKDIILLTSIAADLEQIGDYVKDMVERIEIKIQENLLFSEEAFTEYKHLYSVIEAALSDAVNALKMQDDNFAKRSLRDKEHVDTLVEKYRDAHLQRLMAGICDPRSGNMFLNLIDFTAQIFHHTKIVAKNILKLK